MKRPGLIIFIVLYVISMANAQEYITAPMDEKDDKPDEKWEFFLKITKEYSADAYTILSTVSKGESYTIYCIEEEKDQELMNTICTVVHEACHGLNKDIAVQNKDMHGYYVEPGIQFSASHTPVFNSKELNKIVPANVQKSIFRYNNYISGSKGLSSQIDGVYGMMDELSAYYHDAVCGYDIRKWYEKTYGYNDPKPWVENYITRRGGQIMAFYEFRLFIAWYLEYSEKNYPEQYKMIMANTGLRKAFSLLYDRFEKLALQYEPEVYDLEKKLKANGCDVSIEEVSFFYYKERRGYGSGHYLKEIAALKELFTPELEKRLAAFGNCSSDKIR